MKTLSCLKFSSIKKNIRLTTLKQKVFEKSQLYKRNENFVLTNFFLVQTIVNTFIYLLALFIVQNLKRFLQRIQSYHNAPFLGPKWSICPTQNFFWKIINIILIYLLVTFIVQNFKKIPPVDPEL